MSYDTETIGANLRLGFALTEELALAAALLDLPAGSTSTAAGLQQRQSELAHATPTASAIAAAHPDRRSATPVTNCYADGEASLRCARNWRSGPVIVSLVGYTLAYNTLDNNKNPTSGLSPNFKQDFAGVGGDVNFIRTTGDVRNYYEVLSDIVGVLHLQGGNVTGWGEQGPAHARSFQMGPNLVRGFATGRHRSARHDARHHRTTRSAARMYWGAALEIQMPLLLPAEGDRHQGCDFRRCRLALGLQGPDQLPGDRDSVTTVDRSPAGHRRMIRVIGRRRHHLGFAVRSAALRLSPIAAHARIANDRDAAVFRFSGGTKF